MTITSDCSVMTTNHNVKVPSSSGLGPCPCFDVLYHLDRPGFKAGVGHIIRLLKLSSNLQLHFLKVLVFLFL